MKVSILLAIGSILILTGAAGAQVVPAPPTPVADSDLRDNTIRMRSIELERVKRDAAKMRPEEDTKEQEIRFAETKKKFENIQKLQDSIIKAYTTGEKINYSQINRSASGISKDSLWLDKNLFGALPEEAVENKNSESIEEKSVRDLIIELDNAIGNFVISPIFQNTKIVDRKISKEAQLELRKIMKLSKILSLEADKMR